MFNFNAQRSFFRPTYEDFQPVTETKEAPGSHLLLIHLPGFARENINAKFESSNRSVKVFGERPLGANRWRRFSVFYPVPESCETTKFQRRFESGIVTIIIPKKVIPPTDQKLVRLPTDQESKASTKKNEEGEDSSSEVNAKGKEAISQGPKSTIDDGKKVEDSVPPEATTGDSSMTQKDKNKYETEIDKKVQTERVLGSVSEKGLMQRVEKKEPKDRIDASVEDKNVHEGIPAKPTTKVEEGKEVKAEKGQEKANENVAGSVSGNGEKQRLEKKKTEDYIEKSSKDEHATRVEERKEVKAQKGQEEADEVAGSVLENSKNGGVEKKKSEELMGKGSDKKEKGNQLETSQESLLEKSTTSTKVKAPKDQELKTENLAWPVSENGNNFRAEKKETKEVIGKASLVENPGNDSFAAKERKEITKKDKGKIDEGGNGLKEVTSYLKGKGMKEEAASSSQGLKKKEEKFNEEDKQKMIVYVATAALAVSVTIGLFNALRSFANS